MDVKEDRPSTLYIKNIGAKVKPVGKINRTPYEPIFSLQPIWKSIRRKS